jgi:hypothetical protein
MGVSTSEGMNSRSLALDLMQRGLQVVRACSSAMGFDIGVVSGNRLLRVEIRTAYKSATGKSHVPIRPKSESFDILAMVSGEDIVYEPSLDSLTGRSNERNVT